MEAEKAEHRDQKTRHEKPHIVDLSIARWIGGIDMRVERQESGAYLCMAFPTSVREMGRVDCRLGTIGGKVGMGRVAIRADGCSLETQICYLTMKAVAIGRIAIFVTASAAFRKLQSLACGARLDHLMGTVTSGAHGSLLSSLLPSLTVSALFDPDIEYIRVTGAAGLGRLVAGNGGSSIRRREDGMTAVTIGA